MKVDPLFIRSRKKRKHNGNKDDAVNKTALALNSKKKDIKHYFNIEYCLRKNRIISLTLLLFN